jgi:hypothetical protein
MPGVNNLATFGRWAFDELRDAAFAIESDHETQVDNNLVADSAEMTKTGELA